jgi:hypothetical protein
VPITQWTVPQIVKQVMGRTQNRARGKVNFDPNIEFFLGLDEFCQEKHYWWRRKMLSFSTSIGVQNYDLSSNGTGQANAADVVEIEEMFVVNATQQPWPWSVPPEFNARQQIGAVYGQPNIGQSLPRNGYFLTPGNFQQLTLANPPQMAYTIAGTYYAVPMVTDTTVEEIPLVPPNLHFGLIYMLERRIYEMLYGQEDPRFQVSNARYEKFCAIAARTKSFSQQEAIHASTSGHAVSASGGRGAWGTRSGRI